MNPIELKQLVELLGKLLTSDIARLDLTVYRTTKGLLLKLLRGKQKPQKRQGALTRRSFSFSFPLPRHYRRLESRKHKNCYVQVKILTLTKAIHSFPSFLLVSLWIQGILNGRRGTYEEPMGKISYTYSVGVVIRFQRVANLSWVSHMFRVYIISVTIHT